MKLLNKFPLLAAALLAGMTLASCTDDEDRAGITPEPTPAPSLIGEWLEDASAGDTQLMSADNFKADGTFDAWFAWVTPTSNVITDYDGSYTYSGNTLTLRYNNPATGVSTTEVYRVDNLTAYGLDLYNEASGSSSHFDRIIATYEMKVGDTRTFNVSEDGFTAPVCSSTNNAVATVAANGSNGGTIQAVKRGFAFIKAQAAVGTVVIRVNVTDDANPFDDAMPLLGASLADLDAALGSSYVDVPGDPISQRTYNLMDDVVESVAVSYFMDQVVMAVVNLREGFDKDAITAALDSKYTEIAASSVSKRYQAEKDGVKYLIFWIWNDGTITYMPDYSTPDPEPQPGDFPDAAFEQFDGLIKLNINEAAETLGYEMTDENWEDGFTDDIDITDNEVFESLALIFDEDEDSDDYLKIGTVQLYCKRGITQEQIEAWYAAHYDATGDELNPYHRDGEPSYWVSFKEVGSRLTVLYKTSKRRK